MKHSAHNIQFKVFIATVNKKHAFSINIISFGQISVLKFQRNNTGDVRKTICHPPLAYFVMGIMLHINIEHVTCMTMDEEMYVIFFVPAWKIGSVETQNQT